MLTNIISMKYQNVPENWILDWKQIAGTTVWMARTSHKPQCTQNLGIFVYISDFLLSVYILIFSFYLRWCIQAHESL